MDRTRIEHIFQFMEWDYLSDVQHELITSFHTQFERKGYLSQKQIDILEDIFRQGNVKARS